MANRQTWSEKVKLEYYKLFNWAYNKIKNNIDGPVIEEDKMPTVGKKKFAYTTAGKKKAASYAKKVGKKMTMAKSYSMKKGKK